MKIRPTVGGTTHQIGLKPAGRYKKDERTAFKALKEKQIWKPVEFTAAAQAPNKQEAKKTTKAAFGLFDKINRDRKP